MNTTRTRMVTKKNSTLKEKTHLGTRVMQRNIWEKEKLSKKLQSFEKEMQGKMKNHEQEINELKEFQRNLEISSASESEMCVYVERKQNMKAFLPTAWGLNSQEENINALEDDQIIANREEIAGFFEVGLQQKPSLHQEGFCSEKTAQAGLRQTSLIRSQTTDEILKTSRNSQSSSVVRRKISLEEAAICSQKIAQTSMRQTPLLRLQTSDEKLDTSRNSQSSRRKISQESLEYREEQSKLVTHALPRNTPPKFRSKTISEEMLESRRNVKSINLSRRKTLPNTQKELISIDNIQSFKPRLDILHKNIQNIDLEEDVFVENAPTGRSDLIEKPPDATTGIRLTYGKTPTHRRLSNTNDPEGGGVRPRRGSSMASFTRQPQFHVQPRDTKLSNPRARRLSLSTAVVRPPTEINKRSLSST